MNYLTSEKLVIVGAGGMIGSNMVRTALILGPTPSICLYDIYEPGVHGVVDETEQRVSPGANLSYTVDLVEASIGAKHIISSGSAPRKEGMAREDLLKGNCKIAADFGENIKKYCLDVRHVVIISNPTDVTALTVLIHPGLKPNQLISLVALDSTRLWQVLAHEFGVQQDKVTGAHIYGGHGEQMAAFAFKVKIDGKPLAEMGLSAECWEEIKHYTVQGGSDIIKLRGRSSLQSPVYNAVKMIKAAMGGEKFTLFAGCYVNDEKFGFKNVMMAVPITIDATGVHYTEPTGTPEEMASLQAFYEHLCKVRSEIVGLDIIPTAAEWKNDNANL